MKLIFDEYNDCWVWIKDGVDVSPHFDYEEDAIQWYNNFSGSNEQN